MKNKWVACEAEDDYFKDARKQARKERKTASAKDRSRYKKTDKEKTEAREESARTAKLDLSRLLEGRVLSIIPQGVVVEHEHKNYTCSLRGLLKLAKGQHKHPITVGDFVLFNVNEHGEGQIAHVQPRRTVLSRADNLSRKKEQLIAANIDQVMITASVVSPEIKPTLIDRYIIATEKGGMQPVVVINKIDLLSDPAADEVVKETEKEILKELIDGYKRLNIPVITVSTETREGLDALKAAMAGKASVFSGQSGVGKSSLIAAVTGKNLRVGKIVDKTRKGAHTTTTTTLIPLENDGFCIDTPGIKSFGVWDLSKDAVEHYFDEIFAAGRECKYPDCTHTGEADCAVIREIERGTISPIRYESYVALIAQLSDKHLRR